MDVGQRRAPGRIVALLARAFPLPADDVQPDKYFPERDGRIQLAGRIERHNRQIARAFGHGFEVGEQFGGGLRTRGVARILEGAQRVVAGPCEVGAFATADPAEIVEPVATLQVADEFARFAGLAHGRQAFVVNLERQTERLEVFLAESVGEMGDERVKHGGRPGTSKRQTMA